MKPQKISPPLLEQMPLREYSDDASKADYGKLLVIAGSRRLPGPAILAAKAALRSGCGTVRVAAPQSTCIQIGVAVPELMMIPLEETTDGTAARIAHRVLEAQFALCDAVVIGPGLDENDQTNQLCLEILKSCELPMLVDAQALVALSKAEERDYGTMKGDRVLTPHPGEMKSLIGEEVSEEKRQKIAQHFAQENGVTLVLKGRETLIAGDEKLFVNTAGTRGMGTAGSGDVLAGVIGGLLAQKLDATRAALWGVHIHALAGELAAEKQGDDGLMASDFLEKIPQVLKQFRN